MEQIIESVALLLLWIVSMVVYVCLMSKVYPRCLMRTRYAYRPHLGRGLRKVKSPTGRGIVYEPHPRMRKYIRRYAVYAEGGYKYLLCEHDKGVSNVWYIVIMLNSKNRVIDALDVRETPAKACIPQPVRLHPDTSYIALILKTVNDEPFEDQPYQYLRCLDCGLYTLAVAVLNYLTLVWMSFSVERLLQDLFGLSVTLTSDLLACIFPAIGIAVLCTGILLLHSRAKGVRVVLHENK